jgi:predicted Ser/Thr protein kinase
MDAEPFATSASRPFPGSNLDGYEVVALLGRGGMGEVYRAYDPRLARPVAIKLVSAQRAADTKFLARFEREARAASALSHPNLAHVYSIGQYGTRPYYVMEYVEGKTLSRTLDEEGPLPIGRALDYLRQACEGLGAAEAKGIVHRDIKPENLMVDSSGCVKVVDFGLARPTEAGNTITQMDRVMGTPQYMAPEQAKSGTADHRSDIYALGATFYHLISGTPPFEGDTSLAVMLKHVNEPLVPLRRKCPTTPSCLADVVDRMLAKEPSDRYQTYNNVLDALENAKTSLERPVATVPAAPLAGAALAVPETAGGDPTLVRAPAVPREGPMPPPRRTTTVEHVLILEHGSGIPGWALTLIAVVVAGIAALFGIRGMRGSHAESASVGSLPAPAATAPGRAAEASAPAPEPTVPVPASASEKSFAPARAEARKASPAPEEPRPAAPLLAAPPRTGPFGVVTRRRPIYEAVSGAGTVALLEKAGHAVEAQRAASGTLPASLAAVSSLSPDDRRDGWGQELRYETTGSGYRVASPGPDGKWDTEDDLVYADGRLVKGPPPRPRLLRR